jgi:putative sigma-54 modulation protein
MQISVTGRHVEITEAIRDYAHRKLEHALAEFPRLENVHVILAIEKYRQIAEVVLQGANHLRLEAREESGDMYASIDGVVDKIAKQLRRTRDKIVNHKSREGLAEIEIEAQQTHESQP